MITSLYDTHLVDMYKILSLFTGMGGMDLGFAHDVIVRHESVPPEWVSSPYEPIDGFVHLDRLPFEVVFQNDILPAAKEIAEWNHWDHQYVLEDIRQRLATNTTFPPADVVIGGFPCQDFSHAGKRQGMQTQRGTLYQSFVEVVRRVRPLVFVAENVKGLLTTPGAIETITSDFEQTGYSVTHQLVKCEEHGIPQTRHRVMIIGVRSDRVHRLQDGWHVLRDAQRTCFVQSYLQHLQEPDQTEDIAQQQYSKAKRLEKGQGQTEVKMDGFGPTIRAEHHGNIEFRRHGQQERRLTVREAALIQTFPPDCILMQKPTMKAYVPIGNAVPPLLGYIMGRKVREILDQVRF